jgi:MoaA/NifB/PqqE/SkfB family radical SAM enzyme
MATFVEKVKLLRGLLGGDTAHAGPFFVNVDVTRRCNLRCVGCRFHSPLLDKPDPGDRPDLQDMPPVFFERLCRELAEMGTNTVTITGEGEPFLHPSLCDMTAAAKREGFEVTLVTNGTLLDETNIERLIEARLDTLRVSLLAGSTEEYERNYPGTDPVCLERIRDGLKRLAHRKRELARTLPSVVLHHPIHRTNVGAIDSMVDLAHGTGANGISFSPWKTFRGAFDSLSLREADEERLRGDLPRIGERLRSLSIKHNIEELFRRYDIGYAVWEKLPCYIAWSHARILVDGTVLACHRSALPMGSLQEKSLRDIWNGPAYRAFRRRASRREGIASLREDCDCGYCGFLINNVGIHRYLKWLSPLIRRSGD